LLGDLQLSKTAHLKLFIQPLLKCLCMKTESRRHTRQR